MIINLIEILIFGALFLLSFILISNPLNVNVRANRWFGFFLLLWASYWVDELIFIMSGVNVQINTYLPIALMQFLTPLAFFVVVSYFTNPTSKFNGRSYSHLALPTLYLIVLLINAKSGGKYYPVQLSLILINALFYTLYSLFKIRKHQKNIQQFASSTQEINLNWLEYIIYAIIVLVIGISVFNLVFFELPLNVFMNSVVLVIILFIAYYALKQNEIFPIDAKERDEVVVLSETEQSDEPKRRLVSDEKVEEIKVELNELMNNKELYLESDLNLIKLAKRLGVTTHQLSYVINKGYGENFFQFVNRFRVEKAKQMLLDAKHDNLSILGVAFESGFSSKTSFNTTFKKMTDLTPTEYKKVSSSL